MNIYNFFKKILLLIILFVMPVFVSANEIRIDLNKSEVTRGDEFLAKIYVYSDEQINAIEGEIVFDSEVLEISEIRDGNSVINLWIEKPQTQKDKINFSGITPGGFKGVNNLIFSVVFKTKKTGNTDLKFTNIKSLKNDGLGTEQKIKAANARVFIKEGDLNIKKEFVFDIESPEYFNPIISKEESVFENKWFVSFATQDKNSGIANYKIKELRFKPASFLIPWKEITSPYVLSDQELKSFVYIKATDNAGNYVISETYPTNTFSIYEYLTYWVIMILAIIFIFYVFYFLWRKLKYLSSQ